MHGGCINKMAETVAREAHAKLAGKNGIDGVYAFTHPYGCAQLGGDLQQTRRLIAALAAHPNCAGVLLMGLGCENNALMDQVAAFGSQIGLVCATSPLRKSAMRSARACVC